MLSNTAEYALRALVELARQDGGRSMLGRDLASATAVPANYLSKILLDLKRAGIVAANRGTGGGYRLRRQPGEIRLIEIVEIFDHTRANPRCLLDYDAECSDFGACTAHEQWKKVRDAYLDFLENNFLSDIAHTQTAGTPTAP